jgi:hypothetical protein
METLLSFGRSPRPAQETDFILICSWSVFNGNAARRRGTFRQFYVVIGAFLPNKSEHRLNWRTARHAGLASAAGTG